MARKSIDDWLDETDIEESNIPDDYGDKYTDPTLRWRLKEAIQASGKGGNEGEWSARKAQLLTQEYERRGGDYKGDKDADQQSLEDWTDQDWQTKEGSADAASGDGMSRYLPEEAWALLQDHDRGKAEATKKKVDDDGGQIADWPDAVLRTLAELGHADGGDGLTKSYLQDRAAELDVDGRSSMSKDELKDAIVRAYRFQQGHYDTLSRDDLYDRAAELGIDGRSDMTKGELIDAIRDAA
jgi:hypothetical protein